MNPMPMPPHTSSTHLLLTSQLLRYRPTLRLRYPAYRTIIHPLEKQLETSIDFNKKTAIAGRISGHQSVVRRVSNWSLPSLDPHSSYLQWFEGQVADSKRTLPFRYPNVLDCVRYLLRQRAYQDDLGYALQCESDSNGKRIYAEVHQRK